MNNRSAFIHLQPRSVFCCNSLLPSSPGAVAKGAIVRVDKEKYLNSVEVRLLLQCVDFWSSMRIPYPALSGVKFAFSTCDPKL